LINLNPWHFEHEYFFMNIPFKKLVLSSVLLATITLTGCVVVPVPGHRHYIGGVVVVAPPPLRREVIGVAPARGYIWIDGYWAWNGGRHEWIAGRWEAPRPGFFWAPHRWYHERDGWHLEEGRWERRR
jgi:hypothetical protein